MPPTTPPTDLEFNGETCAITCELNYEQRRREQRNEEKPDKWGEGWRRGNSLGPIHSAMGLLINRVNLNNAPELLSSLDKLRWLIESFKIHPDRHYRWFNLKLLRRKVFQSKTRFQPNPMESIEVSMAKKLLVHFDITSWRSPLKMPK